MAASWRVHTVPSKMLLLSLLSLPDFYKITLQNSNKKNDYMAHSGCRTHSVAGIQTFSRHINSGLVLSGNDRTHNAGNHRHIGNQAECAAHRAIFINAKSNKEKQHTKRYNPHGKRILADFVSLFSTFVKLYTLFDKPLPPYLIHQPRTLHSQ